MQYEKLRRRWEFQRVYQIGSKYWNRMFVIYVLPNGLSVNRLGVTATRKLGNAVKRNRAKRLIRESYRLLHGKLKQGYDVVVVGRQPIVAAKCQQVQTEMIRLFERAKLIAENDRAERNGNR